ncbi:MAG: Fumble domain-containing protein [Meiothermus sp.]|uniref:Fumble domain-containing protein n=1 Tax=Meiothermus sp. TaxID=1955249 RepID=UPI0025E4506C|nr:Fumble domain-containing protein [Meiothermus sp.]MCS7068147.1 Fumble domain-containing protein [Meiothermus sp.]MDW8424577.1 Fumble domain-containing protein [Meiothermus sp.]
MRKLGVDFGLSNTDVVLVEHNQILAHQTLKTGPASLEALSEVLQHLKVRPSELGAIASAGGLSRHLPDSFEGLPIQKIGEAQAVGRGALALAGLSEALVVSAGTGTAMIAARGTEARHFTGSAVGGGTLLGLSRLLLGTADPLEVARLAALGNPSGVDSTLIDVIGGGIGHLPPDATAVNFGRLVEQVNPSREDIAAGLVTLVGQVIAMIAINAAQAAGLPQIVIVGHLPDLEPIRAALERVWSFYQIEPRPLIPERPGLATAYGAALSAN